VLFLLPISLFAQLQPISQWDYHDVSCTFKSGLADDRDRSGSPTNGVTVFLSTEQITCSDSNFQSRGSWMDATREMGGAWIIIEFPGKEIRDYNLGEFWAIMAYWIVGPKYGYDIGYLGTAGLTSIDTDDEKTVSGWLEFEIDTGSRASGLFTVPLCATSANSIIQNQDSQLTYMFTLNQNFPNPFNPNTKITFTLDKPEHVVLEVYKTSGQKVALLLDSQINAGSHEVEFNASDLSSGIYFYRIQVGVFSRVRKMVLLH
jgi:hypothetical protein